MPKNIHQLSIRLLCPHCFHLSAPLTSSHIYLIIFSSSFFDSLSISLPSRPFSGFPLWLMFFFTLNGLTRDRRRDPLVDEETSYSENSEQFGFICFPGQMRGVVFLPLDSVVICKSQSNSGSPVGAWVQMTEDRVPSPLWNSFLLQASKPSPSPQVVFLSRSVLFLSSFKAQADKTITPSSPKTIERKGFFFFFLKGRHMQDSRAKKADRAFAECHSEWAFIFSCTANPLWSGKPPETFWSNSWLEGASLKIEPFRSFQL